MEMIIQISILLEIYWSDLWSSPQTRRAVFLGAIMRIRKWWKRKRRGEMEIGRSRL